MGDPAVPGVAQHPIPDRLLWDQLWPSIPEVSLWDCCSVQLQHTKAPPQSSCLNTSMAHGLDAASRDAPAPGCLSIRPAVPRQPSSLPGCHRFPGVGNGRGGPCSVADHSRFPARSPSPLSASCLRLLPGFTRAISKRSLEIDFYHLVINIVYGDITAQSSHAEEGAAAGRRTPARTPRLRGAPAGPLLVPVTIPTGSSSAKPRHHPSIRAAQTEGAASLAPRAIKHLKSHRNKPCR